MAQGLGARFSYQFFWEMIIVLAEIRYVFARFSDQKL